MNGTLNELRHIERLELDTCKRTQQIRYVREGSLPLEDIAKTNSPSYRLNAMRRQFQYIKPAISDQAKVGRRCYDDLIVEERGIFNSIALESFGIELEHTS